MKAEMGKARVRISSVLGNSIGPRFFRVVALGALVVSGVALYASMSHGEAGGTSYGETTRVGIGSWMPDTAYYNNPDYNESQPGQVSAYLVALDDATELYYDDMTKGLFGTRSPSGETSLPFQIPAYWVALDQAMELDDGALFRNLFGAGSPRGVMGAYLDEDIAERYYDDMTKGLFGTSSPDGVMGAYVDEDIAELPYDQLTKDFIGIPLTTE